MGAIVGHIFTRIKAMLAKWHRPTNAVDQPEVIDWHKLEIFIE